MKMPNLQETKSARVIQVIETVALAGNGTDESPLHEVHQYWSSDGKLLAKSGSPEMEQNLSDFSTGQILKELVKRDEVKIKEHSMDNSCICLSLQIGNSGCPATMDFLGADSTQDE